MIDVSLLHAVVQLRQPWLDDLMIFATALGTAGFLWLVVAGIGFVFPERRAAAWRLGLVLLLTGQREGGQYVPAFERWIKGRTFDEAPPEVRIGDLASGKFARTLEAIDRFVARGGTHDGR